MMDDAFRLTIDKIFNTNSKLTFVIGGSYGLSGEVKERSDYLLSFSIFRYTDFLILILLQNTL